MNAPSGPRPRVVIVGGGFAGLPAARRLARAPVRVTLVDRRNHHVFQPLLYQVATASLSPAQIAAPIRRILSTQANATVLLAEATGVDAAGKRLILADGDLPYDFLILAPGATHSYFGHAAWARDAPGLKTIEDALEVRRRFLLAFERAEREPDEVRRRAELTFVVVGAGPTGVEMAGAMIEIARRVIPRDFRAIDTGTARVVLVEAQDRVLPTFSPEMSARARTHLEELGVEVRTGTRVTRIDASGVEVLRDGGREEFRTPNVVWAAGVRASPLGASLGVPLDHAGRVIVGPDLSVPGHPEVFVAGDLASATDSATGRPVPGVCQGAMQAGVFVAEIIAREVAAARDGRPAPPRPAFRYHDPGILATIGRAKAVAELPRVKMSGLAAWLLWSVIHIFWLINFRTRLVVMLEWAWAYLVFERGARLITGGDDAPGRAGSG